MMKLSFIFGLVFVIFTGCSSGGSGDAMPITQDNINKYAKKMSVSAKAVSMGDSNIEKAIQIYKVPLEDMGYNFDATIINTIKALQHASYTSLSTTTMQILLPILHIINENPKLVVENNFVSEDTRDKILMYNKFHEMNPKTIQVLKFVEKCQSENNGLCTIKQYMQILLSSNLIDYSSRDAETQAKIKSLTVENMFTNEQHTTLTQYDSNFQNQISYQELGKYLIHENGKKVNGNWFISEHTKPFKLRESTNKELRNYNPWWSK